MILVPTTAFWWRWWRQFRPAINSMMLSDNGAGSLPAGATSGAAVIGDAGPNDGKEGVLEALMRRANRGDEAAYALLLAKIMPILRAIVHHQAPTLGPEAREDVVQVTLIALHLKRQSWREDLPLLPWLHAIARHKAIDAIRSRGSRRHIPIEDVADVLPDPGAADPARIYDIDKVLGVIDPRAAEIVRAIGIRGESAAEAGARLNMTEGAVRVALHRALRAIDAKRKRLLE